MSDSPATTGPIGKLPLTIRESMSRWFEENASLGLGDLRANITLEMLQRTETADTLDGGAQDLGRADLMELSLDWSPRATRSRPCWRSRECQRAARLWVGWRI